MSGCRKCGNQEQLRQGWCKKHWASNRNRVGWVSQYVDAQPVRAHAMILQVAGLGTRRIAELAGINRKDVVALIFGRSDRGTPPSRKVLRKTADSILAIPLPLERHELVSDNTRVLAIGTTRRLQALVSIGYSQDYLAGRMGVEPGNATPLFHGTQLNVSARRARLVVSLYDELSAEPAAGKEGFSVRTRNRAKRLGWVDPFGWEDEDLDNPDAHSEVLPPSKQLSRAEQYAELRELGYSDATIAGRFGVDAESLQRLKDRGVVGKGAQELGA